MSGSVGNNPYRASGVVASLSAGREGTVDWDTSIHTSTVTAESGKGYFVNTTGGAITVNLPAASVGDIVGIKDYAGTFQTNACTVAPNGSENIGGASANDPTLTVEGESVLLVYADATQGWLATQQSVTASPSGEETFVTATGGTPCSGAIVCTNYKQHTFTGPGTFCVSQIASTAANNAVAYMVVAGGGGGGSAPGTGSGSGGGAGGFREGTTAPIVPYTASPLVNCAGITVTASPYAIVVGGGGAGAASGVGTIGVTSSFSTVSSAGGGRGASGVPSPAPCRVGGDGGSGAGGAGGGTCIAGGSGNTPPTSPQPPQGQDGGSSRTSPGDDSASGAGGGAGGAGGNASIPSSGAGGVGGAHVNSTITGSDTEYSGGAGGSGIPAAAGTPGGGGAGNSRGTSPSQSASNGSDNTGGGGGASFSGSCSGVGGSGIVVIRYKFQ